MHHWLVKLVMTSESNCISLRRDFNWLYRLRSYNIYFDWCGLPLDHDIFFVYIFRMYNVYNGQALYTIACIGSLDKIATAQFDRKKIVSVVYLLCVINYK